MAYNDWYFRYYDYICRIIADKTSFMDIYSLNNNGVAKQLGEKIKEFRLELNMTQKELSEASGVSLFTVQSVEKGNNTSLEKFVQILRALRRLDVLEPFFAPKPISPIALAKAQQEVKPRKRVRK